MNELQQALLAWVPVDGSSIGNQSLLERLKGQFPQISEDAFWAARDGLIEQGVLHKGRGRGGSVLRAQAAGSSLADQVLSKARERFEPTAVAEVSAAYVADAAAALSKGKAAKLQPATGIEDMKKTLWATADKLRANMDAAEYKHIVLGLIFLKYISDSFAGRRAELERKLTDENDDYYLGAHALDGSDPEALNAELEDRDYYREVNVFWVPEVARWEAIRASAKQVDIGKRIDEALAAIEAENPKLKNILDKRYARAQLPDGKLGELVDLISTIGFGDDTGKARDLLGQVYEYFLGQFASAEGKKGGQFYTPASIVKTLVAVLNPHHGKVYDPCCGSGGMFVQSEKFIEAHGGKLGDVSIYGQESNPTTWRLAAMNLAIRGIDFNLGKEPADTFVRNQHSDLRADFVLANPPFNISDWWHGSLEGDPRWVYGTPPQGNANYAWLQHMLYHLKPNGRAGIVLANGSMSLQPEQRRRDPQGDGRGRCGGSDGRFARPAVLQHPDSRLPVVPRQTENRPPRRSAVYRRPQTRHQRQPCADRTDRCRYRTHRQTVAAWRGEPGRKTCRETDYADITRLLPQRETGGNRRTRPCADAGPLWRCRRGGG